MKSLLLLAATVAAFSCEAVAQSGTHPGTPQTATPSRRQHQGTGTPQTTMAQRNAGKTVSTHPATGPTRASRSSSTKKSVNQGSATGSYNIETMGKNSQGRASKPNSGAGSNAGRGQ
ncbi:hypothetical protein [Hymenobacter weizhouensis]|uniref:hypothetical protein n=1 Tax=Hymenobacter sp. YIM 151500-1 TaxID=2987689 RepID=UPI002226B28B|nr:hypothetical protein [Hymenobacter sp. YIM 151500-1]UYZ62702.1 hypothetical protein OIS53_17090 [Hymenobacter sp. YIM 151500-1]